MIRHPLSLLPQVLSRHKVFLCRIVSTLTPIDGSESEMSVGRNRPVVRFGSSDLLQSLVQEPTSLFGPTAPDQGRTHAAQERNCRQSLARPGLLLRPHPVVITGAVKPHHCLLKLVQRSKPGGKVVRGPGRLARVEGLRIMAAAQLVRLLEPLDALFGPAGAAEELAPVGCQRCSKAGDRLLLFHGEERVHRDRVGLDEVLELFVLAEFEEIALAPVVEVAVGLQRDKVVAVQRLLLAEEVLEADDVREVGGARVPRLVQLGDGRVAFGEGFFEKHGRVVEGLLPLVGCHVLLVGRLDEWVKGECL